MVLLLWALPVAAEYKVEIHAPYTLKSLLEKNLDIARFAKREDISESQFHFLVAAIPEQVRDLAATEGYFSPVVRTDTQTFFGTKHLSINVEEGPRTLVSSVTLAFEGPVLTEDPSQAAAARLAFFLHTGEPFTQTGWNDAKQAALNTLQSRRYLGAKIEHSEARVDTRARTAALTVTFNSGPTFTLGKLDVTGVRRYPRRIVDDVNPLQVGEIYDARRIIELQRQLQSVPHYASVAINVDDDRNKPLDTPVHVKIREYPYNSVRGSIGYSTDFGVHVQGAYTYLNTFGAAWPFSVQGRLDQLQQYGQVQLSMPPGPNAWINSVLASYTTTQVSDTDIYSTRVGAQRTRAGQDIDYAYSLQFYDDKLNQNAAPSARSHALMPQWAWTRRRVDDPLFPRSGNVFHVEAGFAVKGLLTDQTFIRLYGRGQQYFPVGLRDLVVLRAEYGSIFTSGGSSGIPASLRFRAGGSNSVRGYSFLSLGNNVAGSVLPTKYLLTGSAEYQHWFTHNWGAAMFFDIGTAADNWSEKVFYPGIGAGARWRSPVGPVNIDLAYGLKDKSVRPYLTLGIAF